MATRRTTLRSRSGKKLYAVRNADGSFKDIQTYQRAHAADLRQTSKSEATAKSTSTKAKKAVTKTVKQAAGVAERFFAEAKKVVKRVAKSVGAGRPAAKKAATKTVKKVAAKKTGVKKTVRKAAKKTAK
jgi:hypothetical protein